MTGNGRYTSNGKLPNVAASVSDLTHDVIELTELQTQLFTIDAKYSVEKARSCLVMVVIGVAMLLGAIPVALLTIAALCVEQLGWSYALSAGVATLVGLVITAIVLAVAYGYVKSGLVSFDRSRNELRRNIAWLKSTLRTRGHAENMAAHAATEQQPINY
jgi:uncharacterized membrane protein YqjE